MKRKYVEVMKETTIFTHRHWVDRFIWEYNKSMCDDELWMGRFIIHRISSHLEVFSDGSGALLHVKLRLYDKKTHTRKDIVADALDIEHEMFQWMNSFICDEVKVWENEDPYNERKDWRFKK